MHRTYFFTDQKEFTDFPLQGHMKTVLTKLKACPTDAQYSLPLKVQRQSIVKIAKNYSLTNGKWMFYGKTGNEIDQLWRSVTNGVIQGTIHTFCAKVSVTRTENDNHVICIYHNNFLNQRDIFAFRDGIRNAGIEQPLEYKANIYIHIWEYIAITNGVLIQFCIEVGYRT